MGSRPEYDAIARVVAQGPCGICGGPYARHRMIDTQMERVIAGDRIETVAADYLMTVAEMVADWWALSHLLAERNDCA